MSLLNIGGFGAAGVGRGLPERRRALSYRTAGVPVFDRNLKALAAKVHAHAALAHVRGVVYDPSERVGSHNLHPFRFPGAASRSPRTATSTSSSGCATTCSSTSPRARRPLEGTTDTEWVYALCSSQLDDPLGRRREEIADA